MKGTKVNSCKSRAGDKVFGGNTNVGNKETAGKGARWGCHGENPPTTGKKQVLQITLGELLGWGGKSTTPTEGKGRKTIAKVAVNKTITRV